MIKLSQSHTAGKQWIWDLNSAVWLQTALLPTLLAASVQINVEEDSEVHIPRKLAYYL